MCNLNGLFTAKFCTVWYVSVLMVLQLSGYNLHSHLCMAQCKKCLSDLLDLDTHCFGTFLYFNNVWLCQYYSEFQIVLYFRSKHMWGQIFNRLVNTYLIFYIDLCILLVFSMCFWRMLIFGEGELWFLLILKRIHHFFTAGLGDMMNHVYLWELQSGPSCAVSSTHSMLGWVILSYDFFCKISTKGFTLYSSFFFYSLPPSPSAHLFPTTCSVRSHFIV